MLKFAKQALQWLRLAAAIAPAVGKKIPKRVVRLNRYLDDLIELEQEAGAETIAWSQIAEAAERGEPVTLDAAGVAYLQGFKVAWDRNLKKPLVRLAEALGLEEELAGDDDETGSS